MAQTIKLRRSATSGAIPTTSQIELGELALNTYDGKVYMKKSVNGTESIVEVTSSTSGGGTGVFYTDEFSGDGSTAGFTLSVAPVSEDDLIVFIDGVYQNLNSYSISGTTLTFDTAPDNGTTVIVHHVQGGILGTAPAIDTMTGDGLDDTLTLSVAPSSENQTFVTFDGVVQHKSTYSISGTTLTFSEAVPNGVAVECITFKNVQVATFEDADGDTKIQVEETADEDIIRFDVAGTEVVTMTSDGIVTTLDIEANEIVGDLRGAVLFKAQAGENVTKGDVVYISGISGNTTVVSKADADDTSKMPAFGIVAATTTSGQPVDIYTQGILGDLDTSAYSEGDELFVSTTAGALTDTPPTGETAAIQKIAKVTRSNNLSGSIFITGAGRSNAVPNLDDGDIFIGNASNQAVTASLDTEIESYLDGGTSTPTFASATVSGDLTVDTDTLYVDSTNNRVGIGTTSPAFTNGGGLEIERAISATLRIQRAGGDAAELFVDSTGFNIRDLSAGKILFGTSNTERMRLTDTGLGIGTTSTDATLDVVGSINVAGQFTSTATSKSNNTYTLMVDSSAHTSNLSSAGAMSVDVNSGRAFTITGLGRIGIGTSSPESGTKLAIHDSATNVASSSGRTLQIASDTTPTIGLYLSGSPSTGDTVGNFDFIANNADGDQFEWTAARIDSYLVSAAGGVRRAGMRFYTSTSNGQTLERMRIDNTGNVGIGTTSPSSILHAIDSSGNAYMQIGRATQSQGEVGVRLDGGTSGNDWYMYQKTSSNNLNFYNGADRVTIDSTGSVGIGTNNPSVKLDVSYTSGQARFGSTSGNNLLQVNSAQSIGMWAGGESRFYSTGNFKFAVNATVGTSIPSGYTDAMTIDSSGRVGIGTTSPIAKNQIAKTGDTALLITSEATNSNTQSGYIDFQGSSSGAGQGARISAPYQTTYGRTGLAFHTSDAASDTFTPAERMRIDRFGQVGIGTTSPSTNFHVKVGSGTTPTLSTSTRGVFQRNAFGGDDCGIALIAGNNASPGAFIDFGDADDVDDGKIHYATNNRFMAFHTAAAERMRIDSGGGVLIGTTNISSGTGVQLKNEAFIVHVANGFTLFKDVRSDSAGQALICDRNIDGGKLIDFRHGGNSEGNISVSGATVSYNGFSGTHESSGISTDIEVGTVVSTIDELDTYTTGSESGQTRADHAKIKVSDVEGDARVYGVLSRFDENDKPIVASVGIGSVKVTGACNGGDLLESNGDGTAKVQSDDIVRSKTIGKVTIGNSDAGVKLVSCVLYCG